MPNQIVSHVIREATAPFGPERFACLNQEFPTRVLAMCIATVVE